jgi:hypothetical protein
MVRAIATPHCGCVPVVLNAASYRLLVMTGVVVRVTAARLLC